MTEWFSAIPFTELVLLAQEKPPAQPASPLSQLPWIPFAIIGVMFYFLLIRPERKKRKDLTNLLGNLKKNDRIVTIGGIHGVVINVVSESDEVTIRVDEGTNTKLRVSRSAISRVVGDEKSTDQESAS
jgi:preprotein translocase subunit YajC